jgi:hypothetical protein
MFVFEFAAEEDRHFNEAILRANIQNAKPPKPPDVHTVGDMVHGFEINLLRHIRGNPGTRFEIILPPIPAILWHLAQKRDDWPLLLDFHRAALPALIAEPNVRVHNLQTDLDIVCDFSNYKDHIHYKPSINRWILERVAARDRVMAEADIPAFIETVTRLGDASLQPPWLLNILATR